MAPMGVCLFYLEEWSMNDMNLLKYYEEKVKPFGKIRKDKKMKKRGCKNYTFVV